MERRNSRKPKNRIVSIRRSVSRLRLRPAIRTYDESRQHGAGTRREPTTKGLPSSLMQLMHRVSVHCFHLLSPLFFLCAPGHVSRYRSLVDVETELQQFTMDPRSSPAVFARHFENEVTDLFADAGPPGFSGLRFPFPEKTEAFSMPFRNRFRPHEDQGIRPFRPGITEGNPESGSTSWMLGLGRLSLKMASCCLRARFSIRRSWSDLNRNRTSQILILISSRNMDG